MEHDEVGLPLIPLDHLVEHKGQMWVATARLRAGGYDDGDLVVGLVLQVLDGQRILYFELGAKAPRLIGEPGDTPLISGWWLQPISIEGWVPDAPPE